jgi:hypothetical protein
MVMVHRSGRTALDTKGTGEETRRMAMENLYMLMEMCMRESGLTTRLMEKELTPMPMEPIIMAIGWTTSNMDGAWNPGLTVQNMKASIKMERRTVMENSHSLMAPSMTVNSKTMKSQVLESTTGLMESISKDSGKETKCMVKEF